MMTITKNRAELKSAGTSERGEIGEGGMEGAWSGIPDKWGIMSMHTAPGMGRAMSGQM